MNEPNRRAGRPAGSGSQLSPVERNRRSRQHLMAEGATRLDFFLDRTQSYQLEELMKHWDLNTRKDTVQRALNIVHQMVTKDRKIA
ncbi:MAG: hypothetical protein EOO38_13935 [Cytophagaceae bacterium]|nr:MAG: hypothetical protein EOO38_13935 [Cytophagaceae bacterium]